MNVIKDLIFNFPLICAGSGWLLAQILKVATGIFREKSFNVIEFLFGTGGMPSSHTAAVTALATACGMSEGVGSPVFAVACLLTLIVMRDATGIRREAGEQAKVLNRIVQDLFSSTDHENINRNLKELVGHTPLQVFVGFLVGLMVPFLMGLIPIYGIYG
ncbi:MAG: divergent PAP2 family protein [Ruminococcaceae bacterium]|nr:divergent PAP2 family protein [Oscillospiraceae bacterium]